jgi:hypothetical protein
VAAGAGVIHQQRLYQLISWYCWATEAPVIIAAPAVDNPKVAGPAQTAVFSAVVSINRKPNDDGRGELNGETDNVVGLRGRNLPQLILKEVAERCSRFDLRLLPPLTAS